jgi:predicted TIM-barrel fold metal-dependent hydrolase
MAEASANDVVDVNVDLFGWPYRTTKYDETDALVEKLRYHGVRGAWAGSFDALFHKNLDGVNRRLAAECRDKGDGLLVPFGAVNPVWPDWKEDVRRLDEEYGMPGIKLVPAYHGYSLDAPEFVELLEEAAARNLLVQIVVNLQDERMQHPRTPIPEVDVTPLAASLQRVPDATVMLLNPFRNVRGERLRSMVDETNVSFGIANLDGNGGLERILRGDHFYLDVTIPAERLVFGSHVPFFPVENSLFKFAESDLSTADQEAILHGNAERLLQNA